jgi:Protein of unknown function (DUF3096)
LESGSGDKEGEIGSGKEENKAAANPPLARIPLEYLLLACRQYCWEIKRSDLLFFMFIALSPIVSLVAGILILVFPRLLNFIVAIHLIIVGLLGLMHR